MPHGVHEGERVMGMVSQRRWARLVQAIVLLAVAVTALVGAQARAAGAADPPVSGSLAGAGARVVGPR